MEKVSAVGTEATFVVKEAMTKLHGDYNHLSHVRIIIPIRPGKTETRPKPTCAVLRWFQDN
ncbi:MAG TPA: hypothetical protein GXX69_00545 [Firmicutes bacterium]|jgi:hypothetical protein|nr:hypothetical protein [Bacillota bacterium]